MYYIISEEKRLAMPMDRVGLLRVCAWDPDCQIVQECICYGMNKMYDRKSTVGW